MESAATPSAFFPYLRSCAQETEKPIDGHLTGEIPKWLKGVLIRIGSGLLEIGPDRYNHVFDGMALMHQFSFRDGKVTYQNRFLRSDAYKANMRANRIVVSEFATRGAPDPCKTIFQRFASLFNFDDFTDNDLVNIVLYGNEAFACSETNNIWKIDAETLESVQKVNLRKYVPVDGAIAHAHEDEDGTIYNIGTSYGLYSNYNVIKFPTKGEANPFSAGSVVCRIPASRTLQPSYYHSFAMTEGHFVMVEQPLYLSIAKMTCAHFFAGSYSSALSWDPQALCRFHVVRRSDGQLLEARYVATPFFVFHHINAYEEDGHLVMDLCGYEKGEVVNMLYVRALEDMFANRHKSTQDPFVSRARRYVLPLHVDKKTKVAGENLVTLPNCKAAATLNADGTILCSCEILTGDEPWSPELPRINYEKVNGRKYKYFYAMGRNEALERTHLVKVDTFNKRTISWHEDGTIPSEPVFLAEPEPRSQDQEEDSGVVVASLLYQSDETKVSLLVLDARTMSEVGRVTFETASKVPADFHGTFCTGN